MFCFIQLCKELYRPSFPLGLRAVRGVQIALKSISRPAYHRKKSFPKESSRQPCHEWRSIKPWIKAIHVNVRKESHSVVPVCHEWMNVQRNLFAKIKANINCWNFPSPPPPSQALINLFVDSLCIAFTKQFSFFIIPAHTHNRPNGRESDNQCDPSEYFLPASEPCFLLIYYNVFKIFSYTQRAHMLTGGMSRLSEAWTTSRQSWKPWKSVREKQ